MLPDRDVVALACEARDELDKIIPLLARARMQLRDWSGAGLPSGAGEGGAGSTDGHGDPTFAAIRAAEERNDRGEHVRWRSLDPCRDSLVRQDHELGHLRDTLRRLTKELKLVLTVPTRTQLAAEGCALCAIVRLPVDSTGSPQHRCSAECKKNRHQHPDAHQPVYSRRAPLGLDPPLPDRARCNWHYKFAQRHGVDAPSSLSLWHLEHPGRRVADQQLRELGILVQPERTTA